MLKSRIVTAAIMAALLLAGLFMLPVAGWATLIIILLLQGTVEWARLSKMSNQAAKIYWGATLLLMLTLIWFDSAHSIEQARWVHFLIYGISGLLWLIIVPTWLIMGLQVRNPWLMAIVGWAVLIPTAWAMLDLRAFNPGWLLFLMCLVWTADIAAYFAGRRFGKNKLAPLISPGKTWEGVLGALLGVAGYVLLVWFVFGSQGGSPLVILLLVAAWCWVGLAIIGDLFESAVKRQAGVKDSGAMLPGHGGLLDRIDALTSTLPMAALVLSMQNLL
jgi:phosphatidate cytidylyltransferase